jgi:hypothetical protein
MKKAYSRKLLAANQFNREDSRNKVAANKSWFTVSTGFGNKINPFVKFKMLHWAFIIIKTLHNNMKIQCNIGVFDMMHEIVY